MSTTPSHTGAEESRILDIDRLCALSDDAVRELGSCFETGGFTSGRLLKLFGKQVLRHMNISPMEEDYLRRQVLYGEGTLLALVDLFLLHRKVAPGQLSHLFGDRLLADLVNCDLLVEVEGEVQCRAFITPLGGRWFLNDGNIHNADPGHVIQIVMEQPYLVDTAQLVLDRRTFDEGAKVIDFCSGSGVIGQCIQRPGWQVAGYDVNPRAIGYAEFNSRLNGLTDASYRLQDLLETQVSDACEIATANPPYNAFIPPEGEGGRDITLHSGLFGELVYGAILQNLQPILKPGGHFFGCGITLLKDGEVWCEAARELAEDGTLTLLHKPISPVESWEGMRLQFNCIPDFEGLQPGAIPELLGRASHFDEVTWAILIYRKGGRPGFHKVYNASMDAQLLSPQARAEIEALYPA